MNKYVIAGTTLGKLRIYKIRVCRVVVVGDDDDDDDDELVVSLFFFLTI
jgi:hypothetical protein